MLKEHDSIQSSATGNPQRKNIAVDESVESCDRLGPRSPAYPVNMTAFLAIPGCELDVAGVPLKRSPAGYHPATITRYALARWNQYSVRQDEAYRKSFLAQATWLIEHETRIGEDLAGWPISFPHPNCHTRGPWLSASVQGCGISILTRAYDLTGNKVFLTVLQRVVRTFERDILDGGVCVPVGADGLFFEEVAVYPAAHALSGFLYALVGLYDYLALQNDTSIKEHISRGHRTLHSFLDAFDSGFWTRRDLLHRRLSSPSELKLQVNLLEALADYSGCAHCRAGAQRWRGYLHSSGSLVRYHIAGRFSLVRRAIQERIQSVVFPQPRISNPLSVCIPLPAFPYRGGVLTVLEGLERAMQGIWRIEYLTQDVGSCRDSALCLSFSGEQRYALHRFGTAKMTPWYFPFAWLYAFSGLRKLVALLLRRSDSRGYAIILPQDGVFTSAFSVLAAKLAGVRVVCIDHGNLSLLESQVYRKERISELARKPWPRPVRLLARLLLKWYWPSLSLMARISARYVDHYLIPGVEGDSEDDACQRLGISPSRVTRYGSMIDVQGYVALDYDAKAQVRAKKGIAADAHVIAIICRLSPEKGLDIALQSLRQALWNLAPEVAAHVRVVIAGDGPLRQQVEDAIANLGLQKVCECWGDLAADEVSALLAISDIFLYTSTRGACMAMAVLEAMATGCAVIASTEPLSNAVLLAERRGIAVDAGDSEQTSQALVRLLSDVQLRERMGRLAREYIALHHSPNTFRRTLLRATYWSALDTLVT